MGVAGRSGCLYSAAVLQRLRRRLATETSVLVRALYVWRGV